MVGIQAAAGRRGVTKNSTTATPTNRPDSTADRVCASNITRAHMVAAVMGSSKQAQRQP